MSDQKHATAYWKENLK